MHNIGIGSGQKPPDLYKNTNCGETAIQAENIALVFLGKAQNPLEKFSARHHELERQNKELRGKLAELEALREKEAVLQNTQRIESLGVLAGGIAHDINNLLCGFFGFIDLAKTVSKDAQVTRYLSSAMSMIGRARGLTHQLMTFVNGGEPDMKITPLPSLILDTVQFTLSGSNIARRFAIPDTLWPCNVDKNQIGQVIDNIVINALQAMPSGGAIEVSAANVFLEGKEDIGLSAGRYVTIAIKDSGVGIPEKILPRIFDPYFTTKTMGHGLGLATCRSIVKGHGGTIEVESLQGSGSTFHLYLPASAETVLTDTIKVSAHHGEGTILVMDDQEEIRATFRLILEGMGYCVADASSGKEVLDFLRKETSACRPVSGIILDLTVPGGMGGREVIVEIRKSNSEIPVFAASGYSDDPVMQNPAQFGFFASICKPFSIVELSEMLEKHMKKV